MKRKTVPKKFNIKKLPKDSYVMVRSKNGYVKKTDKKTNYIIEVRHRKTKKVIGYINKSKNGNPIPQKFVNRKTFQKVQTKRKSKISDFHSFEVNFRSYILDQVKTKGRDLVDSMVSKKRTKNIDTYLTLKNEIIDYISETKEFTKLDPRASIEEWIAFEIINTIRNIGLRTSPKKHTSKNSKQRKLSPNLIVSGYIS